MGQFFSYKISMLLISNDYNPSSQQQTNHNYPLLSKGILQWLRNEIIAISPAQLKTNNTQYIAQQLSETQFFIKLLLKINYQYFSQTELMDGCNCTGSKWKARVGEALEKYVNYSEKRRFAKIYRNVLLFLGNNNQIHPINTTNGNIINNNSQQTQSSILNINNIIEQPYYNDYAMDHSQNNCVFSSLLLMLLLFLTTRSQNNQQFISRILTLSIENQKQLQHHIEWVGEEMLQKMTERQQLSIRFNQLKEENQIMHQDYQQSKECNAKLIHRLQRAQKGRVLLENTIHQNNLQKLTFLQSLPSNHPFASSSYTSIFRHSINTNSLLNTVLQQKQRKHQQLLSLNKQINLQLDSFEGVLEQLGKERKCVKRELNQRENESFRLQMRVSLKENNGSIRKSGKLWNTDRSMRESDQYIHMTNMQRDSLLLTNSHQFAPCRSSFTQINQSMNMLSKIQQLRRQKQALTNELTVLKDQNYSLRKRQVRDERLFAELSELYGEGLKLCGGGDMNGVKNQNLHRGKSRKMSENSYSDFDRSNKENNSKVGSNRLRKEQSRILTKVNNIHRYTDDVIVLK